MKSLRFFLAPLRIVGKTLAWTIIQILLFELLANNNLLPSDLYSSYPFRGKLDVAASLAYGFTMQKLILAYTFAGCIVLETLPFLSKAFNFTVGILYIVYFALVSILYYRYVGGWWVYGYGRFLEDYLCAPIAWFILLCAVRFIKVLAIAFIFKRKAVRPRMRLPGEKRPFLHPLSSE